MSHEPTRIVYADFAWYSTPDPGVLLAHTAVLARTALGDDGARACALFDCDTRDWEEMAMGLVVKDAKGVRCPHCGVVSVIEATPVTMVLAGGTGTVYQGGIALLPGAPGAMRCACGEELPRAGEEGKGDVNQPQPPPATTPAPNSKTTVVDPRRRHGQEPPATKRPAPDPRRQRPR